MATQLKSGYPVTQLATQLKSEVLCFVTKLGSQKLGSQRVSGEKFDTDTYWLPSSGYPVKRIIKGRPFRVGFDCSHQRLQEGAPSC
jgi:hypothetical protein